MDNFIIHEKSAKENVKCSFFKKRIKFLGHIVSGEGVELDPEKVEALCNWPASQNLKGFFWLLQASIGVS